MDVVIVGGGPAAVETLIGLHVLAGERVRLSIVAADPDFVLRPLQVLEPFGACDGVRRPLERIAADCGARFVQGHVVSVDAQERRIVLRGGATIAYDVLVLSPGARALEAYDDAITFGKPGAGAAMRDLLAGVERGDVRRVAFVVTSAAGWTLPLYELALMTAAWARGHHVDDLELMLVTPEERPLVAFGARASAAVARALAGARIEFTGATYADRRPGELVLDGRRHVRVDRVVALPLIRGPVLEGVPAERQFGFIPTDEHGRVIGLDAVYAAGDATDFPIKQGGLATQQADAVVHHIAAGLGAPVERAPFRPRLRGILFTGNVPRPEDKIAGRWLAPYLAGSAEPVAAAGGGRT